MDRQPRQEAGEQVEEVAGLAGDLRDAHPEDVGKQHIEQQHRDHRRRHRPQQPRRRSGIARTYLATQPDAQQRPVETHHRHSRTAYPAAMRGAPPAIPAGRLCGTTKAGCSHRRQGASRRSAATCQVRYGWHPVRHHDIRTTTPRHGITAPPTPSCRCAPAQQARSGCLPDCADQLRAGGRFRRHRRRFRSSSPRPSIACRA